MKLLIQKVNNAKVEVDNKIISSIKNGLLIFIGIHHEDTEEKIDYLAKKVTNLRIFDDHNGKMNYSIKDTKGSILVVSQFTLYAECNRGNRPDFINAAKPEKANDFYLKFVDSLIKQGIHTETGKFAANMKVSLVNDGPVTILLER
ncbi:MAG: D-aminoacyl-tRNA deacylase [Candidatus Cloacimonetes bacterium]|nr:D-aminoacyl-tRNA deacylase [Candidatus Cloacimonadota bacterium]